MVRMNFFEIFSQVTSGGLAFKGVIPLITNSGEKGLFFIQREIDKIHDSGEVANFNGYTFKKNLNLPDMGGISSLVNCSFKEAILIYAKFPIEIKKVDFTGANLYGADFQNAKCVGVNFTMADLKGAKFMGADLKETIALGSAKLKNAVYDDKTKFPKGFDPESKGMTHASKVIRR